MGALNVVGGAQGYCFGRERCGRHLTDHLLDLRIARIARTVSVTEGTGAGPDLPSDLVGGGARDPGQRGEMEQLIEGGLIAEPRLEGNQVLSRHAGVAVRGRAGSRCALAESIPIIAVGDAIGVRRYRGDHQFPGVGALGVQVHPVRKNRSRAVELLPGDLEDVRRIRRPDLRVRLAESNVADLAPGISRELAGGEPRPPSIALYSSCCHQPVLGKREVAAQGLGDVGVGRGEFDEQPGQVGDARPRPS